MFCVSKEHAIFLCHPLKGCTHIRSTRRKSLGTIDETKLPIKKTANNRRKKSNAGTLTHNKDIKPHFRDSEMDNNDRKRSS